MAKKKRSRKTHKKVKRHRRHRAIRKVAKKARRKVRRVRRTRPADKLRRKIKHAARLAKRRARRRAKRVVAKVVKKVRRRRKSMKKRLIKRFKITPTPRYHRNLTRKQSLSFHARIAGAEYAITIWAKPDGQVTNYKVRRIKGSPNRAITAADIIAAAGAQGHRVF